MVRTATKVPKDRLLSSTDVRAVAEVEFEAW